MSMKEIYGVIRKLGVTSNYKGYFYISDAIQLVMISQERPLKITKDIYPFLASKYKTTTLNIEHNIRTVINVCWQTNRTRIHRRKLLPKVDTTILRAFMCQTSRWTR